MRRDKFILFGGVTTDRLITLVRRFDDDQMRRPRDSAATTRTAFCDVSATAGQPPCSARRVKTSAAYTFP